MAENNYQKAKELFLKARKLPKNRQLHYVQQHTKNNEELTREVLDLLEHDIDETILSQDKKTVTAAQAIDPLGLNRLKEKSSTSNIQRVLFSNKGRAGLALLVTALILAALGYRAAMLTKQKLADIRVEETEAILNSNIQALKYWIQEYKSSTYLAVADNELHQAIELLVAEPNEPNRQLLDSLMSSFMFHDETDAFIITDLNGYILHSTATELIGARVSPTHGEMIYRVAGGETQFIPPFYPLKNEGQENKVQKPLVWMQIPVSDKQGKVIATFGTGRFADVDFTRIIRTAKMGQTGETYAIDKDGNFLSESRFEPELRQQGLLDADTNVSSIINLQARAYNNEYSHTVPTLTQLAALVVGRQESGKGPTGGRVTKPSNDYMGKQVIGSWAWLPELGFGMISQIDIEEAFAPLKYLYILIFFTVGLLLLGATFSFYNAAKLVEVKSHLQGVIEMGQYQIEKVVAEGGMGTVYLAKHQLLKRPTAIKVIRLDKNQHNMAKRFEREVQLASQLSHPNTIEVFDYGVTPNNKAFCAMEYIKGLDLAEVVRLSGPLPPSRVIHILRQVCGSLLEAHTLGLVHRDIKPQNIMLLNKVGLPDFVKVLDFGLAKPLTPSGDMDETRQITGTPVYLSPERLKKPSLAQPEGDIYALGAVAYYLLCGQPLFSFSSDLDVLYQVLNNDPDPLPESVPLELSKLILLCLDKDPDQRLGEVGELMAFLDSLASKYPWHTQDAEDWWKKVN